MHLRLPVGWLLLCSVISLVTALSKPAIAQSTVLLPNPDNGIGPYNDDYSPTNRLVEYKQALYSSYIDSNGIGRLVKFDGTTQTLIPNPADGGGVTGSFLVFNNTLYMRYTRPGIRGHIAKFDGTTISVLENPPVLGRFINPSLVVFKNAVYGQYRSDAGKFYLVKIDEGSSTESFSIKGVEGVTCTSITSAKRKLTFTPQYSGLSGQAVSFWVVNETAPSTSPGPYTIDLYTDNPTITLKASQVGTSGEVSYSLNWLAYCPSGARAAATGSEDVLAVTISPNPVSDQSVEVVVDGAVNQPVSLQVTDQQGRRVSDLRIEQASMVERNSVRLGNAPGVYLLNVSTPTQVKTLKVIKQ